MQTLALQAVDAAKSAGAQYADVRLTRTLHHQYNFLGMGMLETDREEVGVGVRALVNGYWGFAASAIWTGDEVVRLARDAVHIATTNAQGPAREVELGTVPVVTGTWATPVRIDPFSISMEEKLDHIAYWQAQALDAGAVYTQVGFSSQMNFVRQERVLATSAGTLLTQTLYESQSDHRLQVENGQGNGPEFTLQGMGWTGKGWELILDAKIPEQIPVRRDEVIAYSQLKQKPCPVGRYTLVCDGATMASVVAQTFGAATQLDRALGYEADATGTSFIDDPLTMAGTVSFAAPSVTISANRSAPTQLATVQWDEEGVVPPSFPLIKGGVLVDFQTTRESSGWLAPYYHQHGQPVHSNGCAAATDGLTFPMQHMPNLELAPNPSALGVDDLIANVKDGILVEGAEALQMDSQARNGLLSTGNGGRMREIRNGRLGGPLTHVTVLFNTLDFWKHLAALGGSTTQATVGWSCYDVFGEEVDRKGQPEQTSSYSVRAVAATIPNQPVIDIGRRA